MRFTCAAVVAEKPPRIWGQFPNHLSWGSNEVVPAFPGKHGSLFRSMRRSWQERTPCQGEELQNPDSLHASEDVYYVLRQFCVAGAALIAEKVSMLFCMGFVALYDLRHVLGGLYVHDRRGKKIAVCRGEAAKTCLL